VTSTNLGNQLNQLVTDAYSALLAQGELAQLTYSAFDVAASNIQKATDDRITIQYPIGYNPDKGRRTGTHINSHFQSRRPIQSRQANFPAPEPLQG